MTKIGISTVATAMVALVGCYSTSYSGGGVRFAPVSADVNLLMAQKCKTRKYPRGANVGIDYGSTVSNSSSSVQVGKNRYASTRSSAGSSLVRYYKCPDEVLAMFQSEGN